MPRASVPLVVSEKYHVFNRGVDKRMIFADKQDYLRFYMSLDLFNSRQAVTNFRLASANRKSQTAREKLVKIEAYVLLPNHFHLIISPLVEDGLGEFLRRVSAGYTSYFNEKYDRSGSLFQGTFKRVHIATQEQYQYLFAYVNENYEVHGMSSPAEIYQSSTVHYQGKFKSRLLDTIVEGYLVDEHIALAKEIFQRRKGVKRSELLE